MTKELELEFNYLVSDILKNNQFIDLKYEFHHGMNRLQHSLNVAKMTFWICKKLKRKNYKEITRAALLHDFFKMDELGEGNMIWSHPVVACNNAKEYFNINPMQQNIILAHMFPLSKTLPKSKSCLLVSLVDKIVATYECSRYKAPEWTGALLLFVMNFLIIPRHF